MATNKQARGTKRTCQSDECGSRFYDLNRDPITCPICGSIYELASSPLGAQAFEAEEKATRKAKKIEVDQDADAVAAEGEEDIEAIEGEEPIAAEADETFLEEDEEEGGDVSGILGGGVAEGEEEA